MTVTRTVTRTVKRKPSWRMRLRVWFRPPRRLKVTRTGRTFLVVVFGVGLGALNTGNNLLYLVLGLLLSLIVVSGILSERSLRGLTVRRIGAEAAWAEEPFAFRWAVRRDKGQSFALQLSEMGGALAGEGFIPILDAGEEVVVRSDVVADKRGPLKLHGVAVTTTFPFGLFAKTREYDFADVLLVYPRRVPSKVPPNTLEQGPLGEVGDPRRSDGSADVLGLRELLDGEDARRVHWLKSAAAGKWLKVLREREERRAYVLKVSEAKAEKLDRECEQVAALAQRLLDEGHEVGIETAGSKLRPAPGAAQKRRILQALSWAGYEERGS